MEKLSTKEQTCFWSEISKDVEKIMTSHSAFFALFWNMGEKLTTSLHFSQI